VTEPEVKRLITTVCQANGCPELAARILVSWRGGMTATAGFAKYAENRIQLSNEYWAVTSDDEKAATVAHETCHLVARHLHPQARRHHGKEWRRAMVAAGYEPVRCHSYAARLPGTGRPPLAVAAPATGRRAARDPGGPLRFVALGVLMLVAAPFALAGATLRLLGDGIRKAISSRRRSRMEIHGEDSRRDPLRQPAQLRGEPARTRLRR
jgi:hypothetical protein